MNNKLQSSPPNGIQSGGNVTNVGEIGTFNANVANQQNNYFFGGMASPTMEIGNFGIPTNIDTRFYNLLVVHSESISQMWVITLPKTQGLEDTEDSIVRKLTALGEQEIAQIRSYPTIVVIINRNSESSNEPQMAYYGFINAIKVNDTSIQFGFTKLHDILQQMLIDSAKNFGIGKASAFNELERPHWAVKEINVIEALRNQGVPVVVFSY